ncbi:zf-HC2 domain-containing protein [Mitsuaria sp. GD03876]|uniref:zf-HC2 domain-containing protein n=1 Tax=Mitsuaria sp. GD03876 TaxID=2975399 RepID=UPI002449808C|nr:zf-HC2 domain-containing protein [Mitsuaria sp. GD03876]MDH0863998.1 zf-HC2 domain-containing protein [Mitsuaria sp. GD03876]
MTSRDAPPDRSDRPDAADPAHGHPNEHRQVWDAIAWVVAGTATPEQRRSLEAHLPHCAHCRDELALQRRIHGGMQEPAGAVADEAAIRAGLDRLWERDREAGPTLPAEGARGAAVNDGGPRATRWLTAAVAVQAVALCVLGLRVWQDARPPADYVTLSQGAALPAGAVVRLVPEERVDMARLRQVLTHHGLRIVGADEDASSLLLAPVQPAAPQAVPGMVERLRAEPGVLLAEPVGAAALGR